MSHQAMIHHITSEKTIENCRPDRCNETFLTMRKTVKDGIGVFEFLYQLNFRQMEFFEVLDDFIPGHTGIV